jgi:FtsP/CotA-like multicopper oxidase with cupredoxin domain
MKMKCRNFIRMLIIPFLGILAVALQASPSLALDVDLAAVEGVWTPPGAAAPVAMWGFITDTGTCPGAPVPWDVGPVIDVPGGDNTLTVNLRNCLNEDVSIFIPGQLKATLPVTFPDGQGRTRVRSFDSVVVPGGGTASYTWNNLKEGTYLYQSGTFVAKQVPKGLYGPLRVRGGGYPAVAQDEILVYSEIDPDLNNAASGAGEGAKVNNYQPKYFLINGKTYPNTDNIQVNLNEDVLLRFINAGLRTYVPTLNGLYMSVIAEDGNLLPYALEQYQLELTAAKTMDAIINLGSQEGRYALYDRSLHLANANLSNGGMLTFIQTPNDVPIANNDIVTIPRDASNAIINVRANDVDPDGTIVDTLLRSGTTARGATVAVNQDGTVTYTPEGGGGPDYFWYTVSDNIGAISLEATVRVNRVRAGAAAAPANAPASTTNFVRERGPAKTR